MCDRIHIKGGIIHALGLDQVHSQAKRVKKLLETVRLVQIGQNLNIVVHLMPIFIFYLLHLRLLALLELLNQISQLLFILGSLVGIIFFLPILAIISVRESIKRLLHDRKSSLVGSKTSIRSKWLHLAQVAKMILRQLVMEIQLQIALTASLFVKISQFRGGITFPFFPIRRTLFILLAADRRILLLRGGFSLIHLLLDRNFTVSADLMQSCSHFMGATSNIFLGTRSEANLGHISSIFDIIIPYSEFTTCSSVLIIVSMEVIGHVG